MGWSDPTNPVGTYNPCYMTNGGPNYGGSVIGSTWNTCITGSPMQTGANVLSNCTGYVQGRMLEIWRQDSHQDYNPAQTHTHPFATLNGDANYSWLERAIALGFQTSDEPVAGSVFVTGSHVGVVEKFADGIWWISESGYGNVIPWTYGEGIYKSGNKWYAMHATLHEIYKFVLIPDVTPGPGPKPKPKKKKWIYYLKNWNNEI